MPLPMSLDELAIPTWRNMLRALDGMIGKGQGLADMETLLGQRLTPDMFPLSTQIRFVCNMPGEALVRLAGIEFVSREDDPTTLVEARAWIAQTVALLDSVPDSACIAPDARVELNLPNGMEFELSAAEYVRDWALPNFYFHIGTAYAIMRASAVPLGKADLLPHMGRYAKAPAPAS